MVCKMNSGIVELHDKQLSGNVGKNSLGEGGASKRGQQWAGKSLIEGRTATTRT
ncbi:hypothetical protein COMA1_11710 [Candidatus Nitrospira nitrosa]|uniref:Uncharacterized protein n=1 Tax=Candidatus Nitrospira nitrosa TaxID=1742972 RepID=A0A0S4LC82_9BACT|nr:hypothetical protein COMA1_11710 [Candidatus Nitrospira nitrosa]